MVKLTNSGRTPKSGIAHLEGEKVEVAVDNGTLLPRQNLAEIVKAQCSDGNWNYDSYMHGMANGLILAAATLGGVEPEFLDAPDKWLCDDIEGEDIPKPVEIGSDEHKEIVKEFPSSDAKAKKAKTKKPNAK